MRADSRPQPPPSLSRQKRPGRPDFYGYDELMAVWLFVEEMKARTGLSINSICQHHSIGWIVGGKGGLARNYTTTMQTFRSLYYRAARILAREQEQHDEFCLSLRRCGASSPRETEPLPIAAFWHAELERRLALAT